MKKNLLHKRIYYCVVGGSGWSAPLCHKHRGAATCSGKSLAVAEGSRRTTNPQKVPSKELWIAIL